MTRLRGLLKIPHRQVKRQEVERLREAIPVDVLVGLSAHAALTGLMPKVDPHTGQMLRDPEDPDKIIGHEIDGKERVKLTQYLIDKRMPTVKQIESNATGAPDEQDLGKELAEQTTEQLLRQVEAVDADFEMDDGWDLPDAE